MSSWIVRLTFHSRAVSISACLLGSIQPLRFVVGGLGFKCGTKTKGAAGNPPLLFGDFLVDYGDAWDGYKCEHRRSTTRIAHRSIPGACFQACSRANAQLKRMCRLGSNPQRYSTTRSRPLLLLHLDAKPGRIISPGCALTIAARHSSLQATMRPSACTTQGLASEIFLNHSSFVPIAFGGL